MEFHALVVEYFFSKDAPPDTRNNINVRLAQAHRYVRDTGVPFVLTHYPAPAIGGYVKNVDVIQNIFHLRSSSIPPQHITDVIEQAIGVYDDDRQAALFRTFNPFFWIWKTLSAISRIPFTLLENAGLHGKKLEESFLGKLVKLMTEIVTFLPSFTASSNSLERTCWRCGKNLERE